MKKLMMIIFCCGLITAKSFAQKVTEAEVPQVVNDAFVAKFSGATEIQWEKENATEFEVEFTFNAKSYSANFTADGTWKETEYKIKSTELPSDVKSTITKEYVGYTISKAEVVESPSGSFYEVRLTKEDLKVELVIDKSGKIIKKK